jgi:hypothetical protein
VKPDKKEEEKMLVIEFLECSNCGRKILVERFLIGVNHTTSIKIICQDCLRKSRIAKNFREKHPKEAREIEDWLKDE